MLGKKLAELNKALGPEGATLIENIVSQLNQLLSVESADVAEAPQMEVESACDQPMKKEAMPQADETDMEEVDVSKEVSEETGDSDAEERLDNVTPTTDMSLQDLGKAVSKLSNLINGKSVQAVSKAKATSPVDSGVITAVAGLTKVVKSLSDKLDMQETFNEKLMTSLGASDEVLKSLMPEEREVNKSQKPYNSQDVGAMMSMLADALISKSSGALSSNPETKHPFNDMKNAEKGLSKVAQFIHENTRR